MAWGIDQQVVLEVNGGSGGSLTVGGNTSAPVAAGSWIIGNVNIWTSSAITITNITGGGLTWTVEATVNNGNTRVFAIRAHAPDGLAQGTTVTVTFSASASYRGLGLTAFSGGNAASAVEAIHTTTGTGNGAHSVWPTSTTANALFVEFGHHNNAGETNTPDANSTEDVEFQHSSSQDLLIQHRIGGAAGAYTVGGTWDGQDWVTTGIAFGVDAPIIPESTGLRYPLTGTQTSESPWSDNAWTTPENACTNDDATANITASTYDSPDQSYVLKLSGYDFSDIPDGSTIVGVKCYVNAWYRSGTGSNSWDLAMLMDTGTRVGTNLCDTPIPLTTVNSSVWTVGSSGSTWGNALTTDWVKNTSRFGVGLGFAATAANSDVDVDYVALEVFYLPPETTPEVTLEATVSAVPSVRRGSVTRQLTATVTVPESIWKSATHKLTATSTTVPTVSKSRRFARLLEATVGALASVWRRPARRLSATSTATATATKRPAKSLTDTVTATATSGKRPIRTLLAQCATVATVGVRKQLGRVLEATVSTTATVRREVTRRLLASTGATATVTRVPRKTLAAITTGLASVTRRPRLIPSAVVSSVASIRRGGLARTLTAMVGTLADLVAQKIGGIPRVNLTATVATVATVRRSSLVRTLTANVGVISHAAKRVSNSLTAVATISPSVRKQPTKRPFATVTAVSSLATRKRLARVLTATLAVVPTVRRAPRKLVRANVTATAQRVNAVTRGLVATVRVVPSYRRAITRHLMATASSVAYLLPRLPTALVPRLLAGASRAVRLLAGARRAVRLNAGVERENV